MTSESQLNSHNIRARAGVVKCVVGVDVAIEPLDFDIYPLDSRVLGIVGAVYAQTRGSPRLAGVPLSGEAIEVVDGAAIVGAVLSLQTADEFAAPRSEVFERSAELSALVTEAIIEEINKKKVALIDVDGMNDAAKEILN